MLNPNLAAIAEIAEATEAFRARILAAVAALGECDSRAIVRAMGEPGLTTAAVGSHLRRLEARGALVSRRIEEPTIRRFWRCANTEPAAAQDAPASPPPEAHDAALDPVGVEGCARAAAGSCAGKESA